MKDYSFFSYDVHEALHLSEQEKEIVLQCFRKIQLETGHAIDKHSKKLIVANIELFLNYCVRFTTGNSLPVTTPIQVRLSNLNNCWMITCIQQACPKQASLLLLTLPTHFIYRPIILVTY